MYSIQPISYTAQSFQDFFNRQPSQVKGIFNEATQHYKRILYNEVKSRYEFGLPKNVAMNWFRFWTFEFGSIAFIYTREFGWIAQPYGISALDINYQPKEITVSNPNLNEVKKGLVGINAVIVHCFDDYYGFDNIVTKYAEMLAQCDRNVNVNLMTSLSSKVFAAKDKKQADDMKLTIAEASQGNPVVFTLQEGLDGLDIKSIMGDFKTEFIADKTMIVKRLIINEFLTVVGLNNANIDKRERLNGDEVNANNEEVKSIASIVLENLEEGFKELRLLTGLSESECYVKFRQFPKVEEKGGAADDSTNDSLRV